MSLRESCRNRIFTVITKITQVSKYVVMVVDQNAYKILSMICKNEELLEKGVSLIELINTQRNNLQDFDCIYLLSNNIESVNIMLKDFIDEKNPKYKNIHILFTSNACKKNEILNLIATSDFMLKRIKSCACINLNFYPYESRIFYFENKINLYDLYPLKNLQILNTAASELVSVCSCLKTYPNIRYQNTELCYKFAEIVQNYLAAEISKNNNEDKVSEEDTESVLLILDRSIDSSILFIHDYTYQSLCYDLLKINTEFDDNEKYIEDKDEKNNYPHAVTFKMPNNEKKNEEKKAILSENDNLWKKYRHTHIQEVNENIKNEIIEFTEKNSVAKIQKKKNFFNLNEALEAIRFLPKHEHMLEQYWLHIYLCEETFKILQNKNVVDIGLIEQDICCNVDKFGKKLNHIANLNSLQNILASYEYQQEEKARLLLLYFINYININKQDEIKLIESAKLSLFMNKIINHFLKLKLQKNVFLSIDNEDDVSVQNHVSHIFEKKKKKIKYYKDIAKNSNYELTRYEPNIKEIIQELYTETLDKIYFPHLPNVNIIQNNNNNTPNELKVTINFPDKTKNVSRGTVWEYKKDIIKNQTENHKKKKKIIVFIFGGITFPEIKIIYQLSKQINVDLYLGGTSILTSNIIFNQFKTHSDF
ncbi:syntaxin binding protein, putative [Plasmodium berghei]|uniref:Syntaxin-binding protein, putative n=2 Tax=Plasmodium berghei TaxID=5821 RepID=A0A509AEU2_PLABA|nr:syntaxin-binding protein, putative [Plasmodium berghei ANKA]CXH83528.1 syntaxin binding protein, putative [Plasmodium berghei]SCM19273.1 syntaxin binding protein, putative [Plasmodium berghei]SCN21714.1 syntaxin binding protein, putative [Plasmodium berghei]SCO58937.1 syntaxin binding protein, putative [Plasmodium berghei]SCO58987.1 syntaxin binding protein, putative [Plasmodium berghei]|eukprot:XP_034419721.1 syntaxin-binding protein, putative [Plasmodium berghei ANKA]